MEAALAEVVDLGRTMFARFPVCGYMALILFLITGIAARLLVVVHERLAARPVNR